jgi:hypothetical protein
MIYRHICALIVIVMIWQSGTLLIVSVVQRTVAQERVGDSQRPATMEQLGFARKLDGTNPVTLTMLINAAPSTEMRLELSRRLAELAPQSPEGWLFLFIEKIALGEIDDEAMTAFDRVQTLAPYEPRIQEQVIAAGLGDWWLLDSSMRTAVVSSATRMLGSQAHYRKAQILALIRDNGLLPIVCAQAGVTPVCVGD